MAMDTERLTRAPSISYELPVQVALQRGVADPTDTSDLDDLVQLYEELMGTCMDDELVTGSDYTWLRNEALKDENGMVYQFVTLREVNCFEAYFTAYYKFLA
jgi:hypothetical protein